MTHYDPNNDPERRETIITETVVSPAHTSETVETVVVRESNTGWWIAGILGGLVLIAVLWILFARGPDPQTDEALLEAQMDAAAAQAQADAALIQGQVAGAQASVDIARADAARSQAEAVRAAELGDEFLLPQGEKVARGARRMRGMFADNPSREALRRLTPHPSLRDTFSPEGRRMVGGGESRALAVLSLRHAPVLR